MDGFWFVLKVGRVSTVMATCSWPISANTKASSCRAIRSIVRAGECEQLELLQVESIDHRIKNEMLRYHEDKKPGTVEVYNPKDRWSPATVQLS